jgi:hypothetical protein
VFVAVGVSIAGAGVARAQAWPAGATIKWERFSIKEGGVYNEPDQDARRKFLNLPHCICAKAGLGDETTFRYDLTLTIDTNTGGDGEFWVGSTCGGDVTTRDASCRKLTQSISDIDTLTMAKQFEFNLYDVINGKDNMADCVRQEGSKAVWLLVNSDTDAGTFEYVTSQGVGEQTGDTIKVDTKPPEPVTDLGVSGSEGAIEITWKPSESRSDDYYYFQALCSKVDDTAVLPAGEAPEPQYQTASTLCGAPQDVTLTETLVELPGEDEVTDVPFKALQKEFICGEQSSGTAQSLRIEGLENGTKYKVGLLAIDYHGNVIGTYFTTTVTPQPVTDFWEDLNSRDSAVDGGCLLSTTYGDDNPLTRELRAFRDDTLAGSALGRGLTGAYYATLGKLAVASRPARIAVGIALAPLVAIALLWHLLGLPALLALLALPWLWRHRALLLRGRRRRLATTAAVTTLLLAPGLAAADDLTPFWEDPGQEAAALEGADEVKWHAGIRVGPYTPDIDLQFPLNAITGLGPYEAMFGDYYTDSDGDGVGDERHDKRVYQILPMLDVDRIVWSGFGQLGVGGSLGYMQKTAYAYETGTNEDEAMRLRSPSAKNTFRLIPLAATVLYRLTYADDRWGIPVIPYVRGGLSYYMWWMKGPNGDVSKVCENAAEVMCTDEDKAYGGTLGVQVSAGLAVRAERIDTAAARSMRNSGIQHAGFYGEVFWGRVDGFGSSTRLWVGDTTWFAGVNFEF